MVIIGILGVIRVARDPEGKIFSLFCQSPKLHCLVLLLFGQCARLGRLESWGHQVFPRPTKCTSFAAGRPRRSGAERGSTAFEAQHMNTSISIQPADHQHTTSIPIADRSHTTSVKQHMSTAKQHVKAITTTVTCCLLKALLLVNFLLLNKAFSG